jgi:uncharacterized membrane protein
MSNPFKLPPPWNPGYALPANAADEGLERHAYVTKWAPRGRFDNPRVGHGGYAVPGYVLDEGYGEGAMVTKWARRGTYAGPRIPHWLNAPPKKIQAVKKLPGGKTKIALGALERTERSMTGRAELSDYADTLSTTLMDTVYRMPDSERVKTLRAAMDEIDPDLYVRAEEFAVDESLSGAPASVALQRGIARAAAEGLGKELVDLGKGKAPKKKSQLGCAMYGLGASAAIADDRDREIRQGSCRIYNGRAEIYDNGNWRPYKVGQDFAKCKTPWQGQMLVAGFIFSVDPTIKGHSAMIRWTPDRGKLPAELRQAALTALTFPVCERYNVTRSGAVCVDDGMRKITPSRWEPLRKYIPELRDTINHQVVGGPHEDDVAAPILKFTHPITGAAWGMYMVESAPNPTGKFDDDNKAYLVFHVRKIPPPDKSWLNKLLDAIVDVIVKLVDVIVDVVKWVANKTCDLLCSDYAQMVGAAAGAVAGAAIGAKAGGKGAKGAQIGAQAGALGAEIAKKACDCGGGAAPEEAASPPAEPAKSSLTPLLLVGGAGLAALLYFNRKSK